MSFSFTPIGVTDSPYKQKFAIPRQPRLIEGAVGKIELLAPFDQIEALHGLEEYSHLWLIFWFHQTMSKGWSAKVRPPRLGGNEKQGIFATRSTFRPNPIGMSAVELLSIEKQKNSLFIHVSGLDLLDRTPVLDIKPYIPYADSIQNAKAGIAQSKPDAKMLVYFEKEAEQQCREAEHKYSEIRQFITDILRQDPRPAYKKSSQDKQEYAVYLYEYNVKWTVENDCCVVNAIELASG